MPSRAPRKIILENHQAPGDIVMLTAAVRDLHWCNPGEFLTDVRTSCPALWENNPHLTPLDEDDPDVQRIPCHYPLVHQADRRPYHFLHGFEKYLSERLRVPVEPKYFHGDIHLSPEETHGGSLVEERTGEATPYWVIVAGGKYDFTIKWWERSRWQEVVDRLHGRVRFVQVGEDGHHHPPLENVIDLRGRTTLRELVRVVYHSSGVACPVTLLMHLAAAVPLPAQAPGLRPCVVVAGGREPAHWEAYPGHRYLDTIGRLPCCARAGCWRSRTVPLGDNDVKDRPRNLCKDVVESADGPLPRCMDLLSAREVAEGIAAYSGQCPAPSTATAAASSAAPPG